MQHEPDRLPGHPRRGARPVRPVPDEYFRKVDEQRGYPEAFVDALTQAGWMAALIPQEYGGSGLSPGRGLGDHGGDQPLGGNSGACHGQMYVMNAIVRSGSEAQKQRYLPKIAAGELRMQSMGVTEPTTGTDTTQLKTTAVKRATATSSTARRSGSRASSTAT
jgi:acyl-CoA dehydrogenase